MSRLERARELGLQWRCGLQNLPRSHAAKENTEPENGLDDNQGERCAPKKHHAPAGDRSLQLRQIVSKDLQPVSGGFQSPLQDSSMAAMI